MRPDRLLVLPVLLLAGSALRAQSFNLDVGDNLILWPVPSSAYDAAAAQPGYWNNVHNPYTSTLNNLAGNATAVSCTSTITSSFNWPFGPLAGDDMNLMNDIQSISPFSGTAVWTFHGLANGDYVLYTYAWAPDSASALTSVDVPGSSDGQQLVGGYWAGSPHVLGVTYALHHVTVTNGTLVVDCAGAQGTSGSVNGFQFVFEGSIPSGFCFGDGTTGGAPCPCGNFGALGHGCDNSVNTGGAELTTSGTTSPDTLQMQSAFELAGATSILVQGDTLLGAPVTFGDGMRCIGGALKRICVVNAVGDVATMPPPGGLSISARSALLGDPIAPGTPRFYQAYYRDPDPAFCMPDPSNFNVSGAVRVDW